ncbi:MAG: cupin-like domain-containing protein [Pseudomonadota bacterium]
MVSPHALDWIGDGPVVLRGIGRHWPALERWTFAHLAHLGVAKPVTLVMGNREKSSTRFVKSTLDRYVAQLELQTAAQDEDSRIGYLKEFDLLKEIPALRQDVRQDALFPPGNIVSSSAWIGPQGAHTGLHYDVLDNLAVLTRGAKRFYLARPGTVERLGAMSPKYDRWAKLASVGMRDLAHSGVPADSLFAADLYPGDAMYVPHGWWHEVVNLQPSIFLSGFFGPKARVVGKWLSTGAVHFMHGITRVGSRNCTCHPCATHPLPAPDVPGGQPL